MDKSTISPLQCDIFFLCFSHFFKSCSSCLSNTYSIADPFTAQSCQKCPDNAVCLGGSITYPAEGYWRSDESSDNLVKCPQTDSCLYFFNIYFVINPNPRGGSKDGGKNISLIGFCEEGYEGVACSSCAPGYAKFGSNPFRVFMLLTFSFPSKGSQSCVNCKESKLYYVMFGGYLLIQGAAIIFSVK